MTTRTIAVLALLVAFVSAPTWADEKATPSTATGKMTTDAEKTSYALGNTIGGQLVQMLKANNTEVVAKYFAIAIQDVLEKNQPALTEAEIETFMTVLNKATNERRMAQQSAASAENKAAGTAYLKANGAKEGVTTTESGLQYKVIKEGTGDKPKATDTVKVHYKGTFIDGKEFDSSYKRNQPAQFPLNGVIKGWTEGLQLMKVGAKYEFAIPYDIAYGEQGRPGSIPPASTLLFEVELLEIVK